MARFCPLFSGSTGNCTYIGASNNGILIDSGISASKVKNALLNYNIDLNEIKAIFVTHEHSDHVSGIRVLASRNKIPVYLTGGTLEKIKESGQYSDTVNYNVIDGEVIIADMRVTNFKTSHDCADSCGYIIETADRKLAVCTDLGVVTDEVRNAIAGCDLVMLESNHDIMMLQNGNYPYFLKRRVLSDCGHLSNSACSSELVRLIKSGSTRFVLGHLSRENNMPEIALETARACLSSERMNENVDYLISVAPPSLGKMITL